MPLTFYRMIATFFCAGFAPKAPGTVGTIAALPLYALLRRLPLPGYLLGIAILALFGTAAAHKMEKSWGKDPSRVVIDEVVGLLVALVSRPRGWKAIVAGTVLFRVFDIIKPQPVGYIDRHVPGGFGIMADDVVAGAMSAALLAVLEKGKIV